jgi:hypothetical protein
MEGMEEPEAAGEGRLLRVLLTGSGGRAAVGGSYGGASDGWGMVVAMLKECRVTRRRRCSRVWICCGIPNHSMRQALFITARSSCSAGRTHNTDKVPDSTFPEENW